MKFAPCNVYSPWQAKVNTGCSVSVWPAEGVFAVYFEAVSHRKKKGFTLDSWSCSGDHTEVPAQIFDVLMSVKSHRGTAARLTVLLEESKDETRCQDTFVGGT